MTITTTHNIPDVFYRTGGLEELVLSGSHVEQIEAIYAVAASEDMSSYMKDRILKKFLVSEHVSIRVAAIEKMTNNTFSLDIIDAIDDELDPEGAVKEAILRHPDWEIESYDLALLQAGELPPRAVDLDPVVELDTIRPQVRDYL